MARRSNSGVSSGAVGVLIIALIALAIVVSVVVNMVVFAGFTVIVVAWAFFELKTGKKPEPQLASPSESTELGRLRARQNRLIVQRQKLLSDPQVQFLDTRRSDPVRFNERRSG